MGSESARRARRAVRGRTAQRRRAPRASRGAPVAGRLAYVDSSAYVKLPLGEPERDALRAELDRWDGFVSSALLSVEAIRACARYGSEYAARAEAGLTGLALLPIDDAVLAAAARLKPSSLRGLDALHLATALSLGADLGVLITYDDRLLAAAGEYDIAVATPRRGA